MFGNFLQLALSFLPKQTGYLYRFVGRSTNSIGLDVDVYEEPIAITGSFQPIDRTRFSFMGLDESKSYLAVYSTMLAQPVEKQKNPDFIVYLGRKWEVLSQAEWSYANFNGLMCIDIGEFTSEHEGGGKKNETA